MKTKYLKNGLFAVSAALFSAVCFVSCADDITVGKKIDRKAFETIYENNALLTDANTTTSAVVAELYGEAYESTLQLRLTKGAEHDFAARVVVDAAYLDTFNAVRGTNYELYPGAVTFANDGMLTIGANAHSATVEMSVASSDAVETGKSYAVPLAVASEDGSVTLKSEASHCVYLIQDMRSLSTCFKGDDLPKGYLFFEVNGVNPLNTLSFELEDGRLLWDVIVLFAANINYDSENMRPYVKCNPNVQYLLDNNETFLQPLRKRGVKVLLGLLGNHDQAGLAQLSDSGARDFAAEVANYCAAYNLDGVNYDDEYSSSPDLNNPCFTNHSTAAAARLCYETKKAMPDKMVTVFDWGAMYGTATVDGIDADEWIDCVVANYGSTARPIGNMSYKKCSGTSMEFNLGIGGYLNSFTANSMLTTGYGWYMGFAPSPEKYGSIFSRLKGGPEILFGSPVKSPTIFYKKDDPTPYVYPDDL